MNIEDAARSILQQLAVTDSAVTAQNLGKVIRETYTFYLSRSEVDRIIATRSRFQIEALIRLDAAKAASHA